MAEKHEVLRTALSSRSGGVRSLIFDNDPANRLDLYLTPHPDSVHSSFCLNGEFLPLWDLSLDLAIVQAGGQRYRMLKTRGVGRIETLTGNRGLAHGNQRLNQVIIHILVANGTVRVKIDQAEIKTASVDLELTRFRRNLF